MFTCYRWNAATNRRNEQIEVLQPTEVCLKCVGYLRAQETRKRGRWKTRTSESIRPGCGEGFVLKIAT